MNTQWAIVLLILLGLVAAISAAVLVGFLRIQSVPQAIQQVPAVRDVNVLVAKRDIPSMTVVDPDAITVKTVPAGNAPANYLSDPVQAVGKITSVPIISEQALTRTVLVPEGTGYHLAGNLPEGKRAVSIVLAGDSGLAGLLYPGCKVDVLATFRLGGAVGTALSTTMYENIEVLAIGSLTAAAVQKASEEGEKRVPGSSGPNLMVTLLVDSVQAKGIQLATDFGNVSLAMRNPTDLLDDESDAQILSEGRLAQFGEVMTDANTYAREQTAMAAAEVGAPPEKAAEPEVVAPTIRAVKEKREISIAVMRGTMTNVISFPDLSARP